MAISLDQLPDDPAALKRIIADLTQDYEAQLDTLHQDYEEKLESLKAQLLLGAQASVRPFQ